jgi:hypothetical protein
VNPEENILKLNLSSFEVIALEGLPMDIRAVARMDDSTWVIAGGMIGGPQVSDFVWKLSFSNPSGLQNINTDMKLYPVPVDQVLKVETNKQIDFWSILDYSLQEIKYGVHQNAGALELELADLCSGVYWLRLHHPRGETTFKKFIKR